MFNRRFALTLDCKASAREGMKYGKAIAALAATPADFKKVRRDNFPLRSFI
jgi:hypothetical protein